MLDAPPDAAAGGWELVLTGSDGGREPQRFSLLREEGESALWLIEHPEDPRIVGVRTAVTETNAELVDVQRELVRERSRLAAALREVERSNRALDEFAHAVSHDLRAPLRSIGNYAQWVEEDAGAPLAAPAAEHLAMLRAQVARMERMIQGVLAYARAGRATATMEQVDLADVVRDVVSLLAPPDSVSVGAAGALPTLVTERAPLQQVVLNLVANAIAHGGPSVRVAIAARDSGPAVEVSVRDDGPGVPPELRERVWQLFHAGTGSAKAGGTGIGLAAVKRLVEDRGGRAWVADSGGPGADFRFTWPKEPTTGK
jgi:signal transduction histidine kinase